MLIYVTLKISRMLKQKYKKISEIGTNITNIINIDIPNTERAIPLYGIANFNQPTIKTAIEDEQFQVNLCICYIHMKFSNYLECRYAIEYLTSGAISKHEAVFGDSLSEQLIFSCFKFVSPNFY